MNRFLKAVGLGLWRTVTIPFVLPVAMLLLLGDEGGDMADRFMNWIWFIKK